MNDRSLKNIAFAVDPLAGTYQKLLADGAAAGTTKQADINRIFDLAALNTKRFYALWAHYYYGGLWVRRYGPS